MKPRSKCLENKIVARPEAGGAVRNIHIEAMQTERAEMKNKNKILLYLKI